MDVLRPIAPKQEPLLLAPLSQLQETKQSSCCNNKKEQVTQPTISCCASSTTTAPPLPPPQSQSPLLIDVPLPNIPPPSSCCGPPSKNQQGETIRVVTCRCGDSCACIGCDAHPSRAMKQGMDDVYIGFDNSSNHRRLSIAAITKPAIEDHPTSILSQDGVVLCGCGCSRTFEDCNDCFRELCQDYL
jgi:hypothetical protein